MNLGAIDIGSNAARVLIMEVKKKEDGNLVFNKLKLLRYPIRLGFDAFMKGEISKHKTEKMGKMLMAFKLLMELYDVSDYLAFATSAMRESGNGVEVIQKMKLETGVDIKIIDGMTEASILYQTHFEKFLKPERNYIYVDVGGGSTEITFYIKGKLSASKSFKVGTIRLLNNLVGAAELQKMKEWVEDNKIENESHYGIGSGGNINSIFVLSGRRKRDPISLDYLNETYKEMKSMSLNERMDEFSFKKDRADVVVPALDIYRTVFSASGAQDIYVPKIGLSDGMVRLLAKKYFK